METMRKPLQGLWNVVRFNWHFYLLSALVVFTLLFISSFFGPAYYITAIIVCILIATTTIISLLVSWYVYDVSDLYRLQWLDALTPEAGSRIANINAGFDETSVLLKEKFSNAILSVFDFYDPLLHTEVSIKRARKAYPPFPGTKQITTAELQVADKYFDEIFLMLAAHEIRKEDERIAFFKEIKRSLKDEGHIIVTEHLRDSANFMAYNIGFFHFIAKQSWFATFKEAGLTVIEEKKITPFISTFILTKNGAAA